MEEEEEEEEESDECGESGGRVRVGQQGQLLPAARERRGSCEHTGSAWPGVQFLLLEDGLLIWFFLCWKE